MPVNKRRGDVLRSRASNFKELEARILIVCEGEKTEPNYFEAFKRAARINVLVEIIGAGKNTQSIVNEAENRSANDDFDQVWCVFDKDSFLDQSFNSAIESAKSKGYFVAYSNECFELWYILHFDYLTSSLSRRAYEPMLTQRMGQKYQKNSIFMYEILLPRQSIAIRNAKKLLEEYSVHNPARDNPCTTVFSLVEELNKHKKV